jgi:transmembrane sensor
METGKPDNKAQFRGIIKKYLAGKASPEEQKFLNEYFEYFGSNDNIVDQLTENEKSQLEQKMEAAIFAKIKASRPPRRIVFYRIAAAAVLIGIIITAGLYFYRKSNGNEPAIAKSKPAQEAQNDIDPGGNKAVLILADGRKISLDDSQIGNITQQGNAVVSKTSDGQVVYNLLHTNTKITEVNNNTIQTPIGGEYQIVLPDGTKVWLNSSSRLEFPTAFTGKERIVKLSGEGYFEVAKNAAMPFKVQVNDMEVKVLGTHFNIMAYPDEGLAKTTLLEGSINISRGEDSKLLVPGQQARTGSNNKIDVVNTDVESAVAWKNGYFKFDRDGIKTVMRQLARWYDMDVVYAGKIPGDEFSGKIRRNVKASKALEFLEKTGMHFKIEGKKVTIL